jgi:dsRNA-specific ribonuclease
LNNNIDEALLYGIGVVNYLNNSEINRLNEFDKTLETFQKLCKINKEPNNSILTKVEEECSLYSALEKVLQPNLKQKEYLKGVLSKKVDEPLVHEMNKIRVKASKFSSNTEIDEVEELLFKLASFAFSHFLNSTHDEFETVRIAEDVFYYLNLIGELFPSLTQEINDIKQLYYPLYSNYIMKNYIDGDDDDFDIISLIMDFNRDDIDNLFGAENRMFPTFFVEDLLDQLEADQQLEESSGLTIDGANKFFGDNTKDGEGFYLQFSLMHNSGIYRDNYDQLYKKFIGDNISNMYVIKALSAQYNKKRSQARMLLKHVDESKLSETNLKLCHEVKMGYTSEGSKNLQTKQTSEDTAKQLLNCNDDFIKTVLLNSEKPLRRFAINHMICEIFDQVRFNSNDIKLLLQYSTNSLSGYLLKPSIYIQEEDFAELYKLSVVLLNLNRVGESLSLLNKLFEKVNEIKFKNDNFIKGIKTQLKLTEYVLGYSI